jgi:hypothetical protein
MPPKQVVDDYRKQLDAYIASLTKKLKDFFRKSPN